MSQQILIIEQSPDHTLIDIQIQQTPPEELEDLRQFVTVPVADLTEATNFELIFLTSLL